MAAEKVREFTKLTGAETPDRPKCMSRSDVQFLIAMCTSELVELAQTVCDNEVDAMKMVRDAVGTDVKKSTPPVDTVTIIAEQADAAVDVYYYCLNAFAKVGVNLDLVFDEVHRANMAKRFSDGTFHRREDNKIIKPPGWTEPDINAVIQRQIDSGSWYRPSDECRTAH
jgi:predicted HAD superfamily Cof-like phosphohydrolase